MLLIDQIIRLGPALFVFMELLEPLLLNFVVMDRNVDRLNFPNERQDDTFDFIIVGAGSAGCQLANRLSAHYKVLVLEAGGLPSPLLDIPTFAYLLNNQKPVDWAHRTVPQKHAAWGLKNNVSHWPGGRQLGGSSTINGLIFIRGNVQGFDLLAERTGDPRWSMNNVLKYFRKIEDYRGFFDDGITHGVGGSMGIEKAHLMPFTHNFLRAGKELGYKVRDPNGYGPNTEGFAPMEFYMKFGRRSDAFKGQLKKIMNTRPNLTVRKFAYVTKLLFKEDNEVYGVSYERHGKRFTAKATKEVILSAGAMHSPKILMLSGIGPADHLKEVGIRPRIDLPVGGSLQDKYGAFVGPFLVNPGTSFNRDRELTVSAMLQWFFSGNGPAAGGRTEATHAIITDSARREGRVDVPNVHTYVISASIDSRTSIDMEKSFNFKKSVIDFFEKAKGQDGFFQLVTLSRPAGNGFVKLRDRNPYSPLIIDPKYFENQRDIDSIVEGVKFAVKVVEGTKAMEEVGGRLMPIPLPGCEQHEFKSDPYYECVARHQTITAYKFCGTAPMGRDTSDPRAVVDSQLRVFGTKRLRVIDASILQLNYTSENDVTVRALGQLASDMILEHWKNNELFDKFNIVEA